MNVLRLISYSALVLGFCGCAAINFDFIYIDTTHDYQNTLKELEMAFKKTNKRGYISGHDFGVNVAKCDNYDFCNSFGVRDAVNEFCGKYNLSINFLALDGCLSFGIQKN
tara:strand:+ start:57 stop:386 length:330 start_codon:yes stop_codon:yes gene_type:complete